MAKIQVALVDDHRMFRDGLARTVNAYSRYNVLFVADNGKDFTNKISKKLEPRIVLLDINMPLMDGPATAAWIKENYPGYPRSSS